MMNDANSKLAALLREEDRPCDEIFVEDVDWLIGLDIEFALRRRATLRRWAIDLGSTVAVAVVGYVIADSGRGSMLDAGAVLSIPLLIVALLPALWLFTKSQSLAT